MGFVYFVDRINTFIGKTVAWSIVALTFAVCYEVFARYVLRAPTEWAFDASYMLYGLLFMVAGPYTLARNNHVRGDFIYRNWSPRRQAATDLLLYFLFFFPGILALVYAGIPFTEMSWLMREHSMNSPSGPPIYPFKALIPIVGILMAFQGVAEVIRCISCLRNGTWPPRLHDVEETEKLILERAEQEGLTKGTV
ncbi:TRAP transporter small permease subunit [Microvirga solisilvae]|uniref:TRAP transporter small permease subunit n=1 Tax=Microvirga solisilvae TaxID=2919498 RepID=UPI001FAFF842|nr:TRAP transporter small permease subunit [Microvirga solisilvae]